MQRQPAAAPPPSRRVSRAGRRRGMALIYTLVVFSALVALVSLSVDYGRAQMTKSELQRATDAAALYGIAGLRADVATAQGRAIDAANDNAAAGVAVALSASDIEFGVWNTADGSFDVLAGAERQSATALRITARTTSDTVFAALLGKERVDVRAVSIAVVGKDQTFTIPALGCPWLAGMPAGTHIAGQADGVRAPQHSPLRVSNVPIKPGSTVNFRNTTGQTGDTTTGRTYGLDGDLTRPNIRQVAVNGINSTTAPLNALVGIFLDDRAPDAYTMPEALDFSTSAKRSFDSFSPKLKQVFFIGDGVNNANNRLQDFIVPGGATRLYLGVMDENAFWWDNVGSIETTMYDGKVMLVR